MAYLGIFWYDENNGCLDGVYKDYESNVVVNFDGTQFFPTLHRDVWDVEHGNVIDCYGDPLPGCEDSIFITEDYTQVPRGRVSADENSYIIYIGEWIENDYNYVLSLIIEEFALMEDEIEVIIDEHWNIGHGWSE